MGLNTKTTWTANDWVGGEYSYASLERSGVDEEMAEFSINHKFAIRLSASGLRELSRAAELIAEELEEEK